MEYADGRTAINIDNPVWPPGQQDHHEPILMASGGGGGDLSLDQGFWLSPIPIPPDGALTFVCSWLAFGIDETRQVIERADRRTSSRSLIPCGLRRNPSRRYASCWRQNGPELSGRK